jgi:hypothetical protein
VSPTRRRQSGDSSLDATAEIVGTAFTELADGPAGAPEEPAWMRGASGTVDEDPAVASRPDPAALAVARAARTEQIVRALNPEQARAVTTT